MKDDLIFNVNASCGIALFAIMKYVEQPNEHDQPRLTPDSNIVFHDGFSFDGCVPVAGSDSVDIAPRWGEHTLQELVGEQVYAAIELKCAILHAMTFTARQEFF